MGLCDVDKLRHCAEHRAMGWWEDISVAYSNVAGGQTRANVEGGSTLNWGAGNIDADPCFADSNKDDFHSKSQAAR
jgi:hypothetical protein